MGVEHRPQQRGPGPVAADDERERGLGPGLVATFLGAAAGDYFFHEPRYSFEIHDLGTAYGLGLFVLAGTVISGLMESLHRSRRRIAASERRYAVTLASIGDAVIATDT